MKRIKPGFTLAEVLITLGIIGVVAAIVMPSIMTNYTYKTVGVKLSKFASQLEAATRPYVVQNTSFTGTVDDISAFVEESFLIKNSGAITKEIDCSDATIKAENAAACGDSKTKITVKELAETAAPTFTNANLGSGANFPEGVTPIVIKDGTSFVAYPLVHEAQPDINVAQVGNCNKSSFMNCF